MQCEEMTIFQAYAFVYIYEVVKNVLNTIYEHKVGEIGKILVFVSGYCY